MCLPQWTKTTTDFLGRTVKTEKPTFNGQGTAVSTTQYSGTSGRPFLASQPGQADTLHEYDALGNRIRSGLDVNGDGQLTLLSDDRINDSDTVYEQDTNDHWWRVSTSTTYAGDDPDTPEDERDDPVVSSVRRQRLTGLGTAAPAPYSGVLTAESRSEDIHGNLTVSRTYTDAASKTVWQVTDTPTSTVDTVTKTVNGLLVSSTSPSNLTTHYLHDPLGRRTGVTDPRISTYDAGTDTWSHVNRTHYNTLGQVDWTEDTDGNRTTYAYHPDTGRRTAVTNPLDKTEYTSYTPRGQVHRKWGDTPYPVQYLYDEHNRMVELHTFRGGTGWDGSVWPADPGDADITTWVYDDHTGLLEQKLYDDGHGPAYTYTDAGRLETRTWARTDDQGNPLVTTYTYHPDTGQLTETDYSDTTPDITTTYTRLGQKKTVTDATGTRTFAYSATTLQPETETLDDTFFSSANLLTRSYDPLGRNDGYQLGTAADPDAVQWVDYNHDQYGRLNQVASSDFPAPAAVTYTYHPESDWLHATTYPNGLTTTREPEAHRNLVDSVRNNLAGTTVSEYNYTNDPAGRRTDVVMTGTAFNQNTFNAYDYNDRNEVVGGQKYQGIDPNDKTNPIPSYDYDYNYDPIGNRQTFTDSGTQTTYTANNLNQYTQLSSFPTQPSHDLDGNMTFLPSTSGGGAGGEGWHCQWNGENRLIAMETAGPAVDPVKLTFTYDYMGRRVRKRSYSGSAILGWTLETDLRYIYDGWNLIAQFSLQPSSLIPDKTYTWGLDLSQSRQGAGGVGGLLATRHPSTSGGGAGGEGSTYYACYDANGNISEYLAPDGTIAAHYEYSPFGQLTAQTGTTPEAFHHRFSTKYFDDETELYYYGFRFYEPELGRWPSRDPIGVLGGLNVYGFVKNLPVTMIDILGLVTYEIKRKSGDEFDPNPEVVDGLGYFWQCDRKMSIESALTDSSVFVKVRVSWDGGWWDDYIDDEIWNRQVKLEMSCDSEGKVQTSNAKTKKKEYEDSPFSGAVFYNVTGIGTDEASVTFGAGMSYRGDVSFSGSGAGLGVSVDPSSSGRTQHSEATFHCVCKTP